jgi:hypothetical protein
MFVEEEVLRKELRALFAALLLATPMMAAQYSTAGGP